MIIPESIGRVAQLTNRAILFHSATGKDSIALLDMIAPYFKEVVCAYMYIVRDLRHVDRYISWACRKYPNVRFVQLPHFVVYTYRKYGFLGCYRDPKQKLYRLAELNEQVRAHTGIDWTFFGFKQADGMNRRLMLRQYEGQQMNSKSRKCYPLSRWKNADVLRYIHENNLIEPMTYGLGGKQSSGQCVDGVAFLSWLRDNEPESLRKVYAEYPMAERILFEFDDAMAEYNELNQD